MASLGMTKAQAVDRCLIAIGQQPFNGTSMASGTWPNLTYVSGITGQVEHWLDDTLYRIQTLGTPYNVVKCKTFTADGSGNITLASDTLNVVASGKSQHRNFQAIDGAMYDQDNGTATFTASETVQADLYRLIEFAKCPPPLKEKIVAEAVVFVQAMYRGNMELDQTLRRESDRTIPPGGPLVSVPASPVTGLSGLYGNAASMGGGRQG